MSQQQLPPPPSWRPPPPGWYPHPQMPGTQRYWNGSAWSEHVAPAPPSATVSTTNDQTMAVLALVFAVIVPLLGFILGIICAARGREVTRGVIAIVLSIFFALLWYTLLANQAQG